MNVVAIVGPTASGKSSVAEALAAECGAVIVSVDSMQAYKRMDIGTAKPTLATRTRIPHRMIDIVEPSEDLSAKMFQDRARFDVERALETHGRVVIAGGSGLHFRALVDPMTFHPTDPRIRAHHVDQPLEVLRDRLLAIDPDAEVLVDLDNTRRVVRALEVYEITGLTPTERAGTDEAKALEAYHPLIRFAGFGMDAGDSQSTRVAMRFHGMLEAGLLAEVEALAGELGQTAGQALGYKQLLPVVRGEQTLAVATERAIAATNGLVKRQRTFFRRDPRIAWLPWQDEGEQRVAEAVAAIRKVAQWIS